MGATDQSGLDIRKGFVQQGRGLIFTRVVSVDVPLRFESDLNRLGGSIIGVLQQFAKDYKPVFRLSAFLGNL